MSDHVSGGEPAETLASARAGATSTPGLVPRAPLKLRTIFGASFRFFGVGGRPNLGVSLVLYAALTALGLAISALVGTAGVPYSSALSTFVLVLLNGIVAISVAAAVNGQKLVWSAFWARLKPRLAVLLAWSAIAAVVTGVIYGPSLSAREAGGAQNLSPAQGAVVVVAGALSLLVVFYTVRLVYVPAIITVEGVGLVSAVRRSFFLSRRYFWWTVGVLGLTFLAVVFLSTFITVALNNASAPAPVVSIVVGLINTVTTVFISAVLSLMYINLRFTKDGPQTTI